MKKALTQRLRLNSGAVVDANFNMKGFCKKCGKEFHMAVTRHKIFMPIISDGNGGYDSHYDKCKQHNPFLKNEHKIKQN